MATQQAAALHVKGLGKLKMAAVVKRAKGLGMSPQQYLKHLVEEDLAISQRAKISSFEELLGPGRETDESEIDRLVDQARTAHHREKRRKGKTGTTESLPSGARHEYGGPCIREHRIVFRSDSHRLPVAAYASPSQFPSPR